LILAYACICLKIKSISGRDCMIVGLTTTCPISTCHH